MSMGGFQEISNYIWKFEVLPKCSVGPECKSYFQSLHLNTNVLLCFLLKNTDNIQITHNTGLKGFTNIKYLQLKTQKNQAF